jgi:hypothetical protein
MDYQIHNARNVSGRPVVDLIEEGNTPLMKSRTEYVTWLQGRVDQLRATRELAQVLVYSTWFRLEGSFIAIEAVPDTGVGPLVLIEP